MGKPKTAWTSQLSSDWVQLGPAESGADWRINGERSAAEAFGNMRADMNAGARIHEQRTALGIPVRELARRARVSPGDITYLERGRAIRDPGALGRVAAVLDLPASELLEAAGRAPQGGEARAAGGSA